MHLIEGPLYLKHSELPKLPGHPSNQRTISEKNMKKLSKPGTSVRMNKRRL